MTTDEQPLAIAGTRKAAKELADGTLRVQIDIEPRDKQAFHRAFPEIDMPVAIAPLNLVNVYDHVIVDGEKIDTDDLDMRPGPITTGHHPHDIPNDRIYGQHAKKLRTSGFFRVREVWKAIGSDSDYLDWIRKQDCIVCGNSDWNGETGEEQNEPAHVRRIEHGAGTGIKPPYSAVPMCHEDHACQHNNGEVAIYNLANAPLGKEDSSGGMERLAEMWLDREWLKHVESWAWETLKAELGYDSWAKIPPTVLLAWAQKQGVERFLPDYYRES